MKHRQWILGALLAAGCAAAQAQWVWKDANNVRHLSDQPPPPSVPASRILKAPRGQMPDLRKELAEQPTSANASVAIPAPAAPARTPLSTAERNAEFNKRRAEGAQQAEQAAAQARNKAATAAACDGARSNLRVLESGIRIAAADRNGERVFLDDAQKAEQVRRNRDALAAHCPQ
ncbi:DUF4124 domain-containing protein [Pseudoduganella umbonata]|uniref:DUF4124 domain-containing protein n=1 Tax=Pseudoduganella umbonata TaxID=864828 RepID=A0A4P8HPV0_9BURK|nr:DUF4124 domain-containing protein [Pseudoduganella umbonata]MBB3221311.1 hypothetical protein [Pseudoduganella umbonata]QCP10480.1 DUF4124 domain-containing protein [Pseudoduganella umbonata]